MINIRSESQQKRWQNQDSAFRLQPGTKQQGLQGTNQNADGVIFHYYTVKYNINIFYINNDKLKQKDEQFKIICSRQKIPSTQFFIFCFWADRWSAVTSCRRIID